MGKKDHGFDKADHDTRKAREKKKKADHDNDFKDFSGKTREEIENKLTNDQGMVVKTLASLVITLGGIVETEHEDD